MTDDIHRLISSSTSRLLTRMPFAVTPIDAATYAGAALLLTVAALAATVIATRRATRIDPVNALRSE